MKITRHYASFLLPPWMNQVLALHRFKQRAWQDPAEEDCLRDTVIDRKRLEFARKLVQDGRLNEV